MHVSMVARLVWVVGFLWAAPVLATEEHFILILDDSGSMEQMARGAASDSEGFGLAVPQIFHNVLSEVHSQPRLTVLTLPQGSGRGVAPILPPERYLSYPRTNDTYFAPALKTAIKEAKRHTERPVTILLVTDGVPSDMSQATEVMAKALKEMENLRFKCVLIGASVPDSGLCEERNTRVRDGRAMAQVTTADLAASMGSLSDNGELSGMGKRHTFEVGKYVRAVHVTLMGTRAGTSFGARLLDTQGAIHVGKSHKTRPMAGNKRLALQTIFVVNPNPMERGRWSLDLPSASGPVVYGIIFQYDLDVELILEQATPPGDDHAQVRARLLFQGRHFKEQAFFEELGVSVELSLKRHCREDCEKNQSVTLQKQSDYTFNGLVPIQTATRLDAIVHFKGKGVSLRSTKRSLSISQLRQRLQSLTLPDELKCAMVGQPHSIKMWPVDMITGQRLSEAEINAENLTLDVEINGRKSPMMREGDAFTFTWTPKHAGTVDLRVILKTQEGVIEGPLLKSEVVADVVLPEVVQINFGNVASGCETLAHCAPLEIEPPDGVLLNFERVAGQSGEGWAALKLHLRQNGESFELKRNKPIERRWSSDSRTELCYAPPGCSKPPTPALERVRISHSSVCLAKFDQESLDVCKQARSSECVHPRRTGTIEALAVVKVDSWLSCNLWWILILIALMVLMFVIYGFVSPHEFSQNAMLRVANQERQLSRDADRPLRSVPHGRKGFYRSATCCFEASGRTVERNHGHVLMIKAGPNRNMLLLPRGSSLERKERNRWMRIEVHPGRGPSDMNVDREPQVLTETWVTLGEVYRVNGGDFFFVIG